MAFQNKERRKPQIDNVIDVLLTKNPQENWRQWKYKQYIYKRLSILNLLKSWKQNCEHMICNKKFRWRN